MSAARRSTKQKLKQEPVAIVRARGDENDVDDITDFTLFWWNLLALGITIVENTSVVFIQVFTYILLGSATVLLMVFLPIVNFVRGIITGWYSAVNEVLSVVMLADRDGPTRGIFSRIGATWTHASNSGTYQQLSFVNNGTPDFLTKYDIDWESLEPTLMNPPADKMDLDLAYALSHFVGAVYESNDLHNELFLKWGFQPIRLVHNSCSVTVASKVVPENKRAGEAEHVVLFIIFKGTSPLAMNEWLTDFSMAKVSGYKELDDQLHYTVPGAMHQGFFKAFFSQETETDVPAMIAILKACRDSLAQQGFDIDNENDMKKVRTWVTGHSLGAALATCFTTMVLASDQLKGIPKDVGFSAPQKSVMALRSSLTGVYTYGNPKCGDTKMATWVNYKLENALNRIPFIRIRNCNDIVGAAPLGSGFFREVYKDIAEFAKAPPNAIYNVSWTTDFETIGTEYRLKHTGADPKPHPSPTSPRGAFADIDGTITARDFVVDVAVAFRESLKANSIDLATVVNTLYAWRNLALIPFNLKNKTALGLTSQIALPNMIFDHVVSEYAANIERVRQNKENKSKKA